MDQYHGQGGSYLLDPVTGERVPIDRPQQEQAPLPTPKRKRARVAGGKFRGDDPTTPETNEAWQ